MYRTLVLLALLAALPIAFVVTGCGPKGAKPETMTELEAAESAAKAAEAELQELEAELKKCGMDRVEKENKIETLERERNQLKMVN